MKKLVLALSLILLAGCGDCDDECKEDIGNIAEDIVDIVKDDKDTEKEALSLAVNVIDLVAVHEKKKEKADGS